MCERHLQSQESYFHFENWEFTKVDKTRAKKDAVLSQWRHGPIFQINVPYCLSTCREHFYQNILISCRVKRRKETAVLPSPPRGNSFLQRTPLSPWLVYCCSPFIRCISLSNKPLNRMRWERELVGGLVVGPIQQII